jgi:hypothetical protein
VRNSLRALVVATAVPAVSTVLAVALAGPASAAVRTASADDPGPGLTVAETLGIYVGIPALIIGVIWALVYAGTSRKGPRYPAAGSDSQPLWFGGPDQPEHALDQGQSAPESGGARGSY